MSRILWLLIETLGSLLAVACVLRAYAHRVHLNPRNPISQFVSALTENQILAFILSLVVCVVLFGVGTEAFSGLFADRWSAVLRAMGTGSRFESIARGVIDLRDVVYYLSLTAFFLSLSVGALRAKRWA